MSKPRTENASGDEPIEPIEPLDPALAQLFANAPIPEPSFDVRARVFRRVANTIVAPPIAPNLGAPFAKALVARSIALATATFVFGGVVGATAAVALRPAPAPQVTYVDRPTPSVLPPATAEVPASVIPASPTASSARRPSPPPTAANPADTLRIERGMIDDARSKLASGDAQGALDRLAEHAQRFPKARLDEEREALAIQALANVGRTQDARARATAFRVRWPMSVYGAAVDATLESIP